VLVTLESGKLERFTKCVETRTMTQFQHLLCQAWKTNSNLIHVYETAIGCAVDNACGCDWKRLLAEATRYRRRLLGAFRYFGLNPQSGTIGCLPISDADCLLSTAMRMAMANGDMKAAQLVAQECVKLAEAKDHLQRELIARYSNPGTAAPGERFSPCGAAC
jgi:hypothetical protein